MLYQSDSPYLFDSTKFAGKNSASRELLIQRESESSRLLISGSSEGLVHARDAIDFDLTSLGSRANFHGGAGRVAGEISSVDFVHDGRFAHVFQVNGGLDHPIEVTTRRLPARSSDSRSTRSVCTPIPPSTI